MGKIIFDTLEDIACPYCDSFNTYIFGTDELDFSPDGTGFYSPDCHCCDCDRSFRMFYNFNYQITDSYVRK